MQYLVRIISRLAAAELSGRSSSNHEKTDYPLFAPLIRGARSIRANRDGAIAALVDWGRVTPDIAAATYDSSIKAVTQDGTIPEDGLNLVIEQAKTELKITREVPPAEVADFGLLNQAQKELGLK